MPCARCRALADADIFLLPSHAEPLGVVMMEAMAMAVPVIATRAGGVAEIVTDGVDGLMVPPGDALALAQAIHSLGGDPERATALGAAGRRSVVQRFDARVGAHKLLALLSGRPPIELAA
jgi:colanic acid/amylovoran biosynthesis glycosyltransferase